MEKLIWKPEYPTDFYHVTPLSKVSSIRAEGLRIPHSRSDASFAFPERPFRPVVYLWGDSADAYQFAEFLFRESMATDPLAILEVSLSHGWTLYLDPDTPFIMCAAFMSFEPIPPDRVKLLGIERRS